MPFDNLLDEFWVCGPQIRAGRLIQLKFKATPQLRHVEGLVPAPADLWGNVKARQSYSASTYCILVVKCNMIKKEKPWATQN